ncbi:hypothetical protein CWO91_36810 [Bradyrhizobium genosp. SA-3]|uniref:hypothetical protein n=1 Tax=Bradyrhizobium genosp. SA-3 TaxID=508868 RepID=UPI001028C1F0|nr:hypothetical protein [Bradyrhizobium genosp. SA-3]RZM98712.1 hypothetical protein CWO91_36810 [Bradyrhizobium genosp. SA-3]
MSERNQETGQFTTTAYGEEGLLRDAGYVPYKDDSASEQPDELTVDDAAANLTASRTAEAEIRTFSPIDLPDNVALTLDQAAKLRSDAIDAERTQAQQDEDENFRKEIDELRGVTTEEKVAEPAFDPEKAMEHPQVKDAIQKVTAETEAARLQHVSGLAAATQMAEATFFSQFPELAGLDGEQRVQAFAAIAQNDPQRAEQIRASVNGIANLFQQYSAENGKLTAEREAKFKVYAKAESDRFEEMIKDTPKARRAEIEGAIVEAIKEYGGDAQEFARLMQGSEFASATVQRLLWDVGRLRLVDKAAKPAPGRQPLPPVQRPGARGSVKAANEARSVAALSARLAESGSIDDAVALYQARRKG